MLADGVPFFTIFRKQIVGAMSQSNMNRKRQASHWKIMFYRDTQTFVIHISRGTCARGDKVIHISFALAQHISQRGLKKVLLILHVFEGVVLELYESPKTSACRATPFFSVPPQFVLSVLYRNHKI